MDTTYRGFTLSSPPSSPSHIVRAQRGRIRLHVQLQEGPMPQGWTLQDVLRLEIDRLIDPKVMRNVDHLN